MVIPQLKGVLAVVIVLKTIFALKMFDQVVTLTGAGPGITTQTFAHYVYTIGFVHYDMGLASALAWILTIVLRRHRRLLHPARPAGAGARLMVRATPLSSALQSAALLIFFGIIVFPIAWVALTAFKQPRDLFSFSIVFTPTIENFFTVFQPPWNLGGAW